MEPEMVANYAEYPTAKDLWSSLAATYSQGSGGIQIYELSVRANTARLGTETIEEYYSRLQRIWREIEARQPNPMVCPEDISTFNRLRSESKLYQFLARIGEEYEADRRDLLKQEPLPSPEAAYATVRRERDRKITLGGGGPSSATKASGGIGAGLIMASQFQNQPTVGQGITATQPRSLSGKFFPTASHQGGGKGGDRSRLKCSNCGKSRHTKDE